MARKEMLVMGDFHLDYFDWINSSYSLKEPVEMLKMFMANVTLTQVV